MKLKTFLMVALSCCFLALPACDDDDENFFPDNSAVVDSFNEKYPEATNVYWGYERGYWIADFYDLNKEKEAWFERDGTWALTEIELSYTQLPHPVRDSFEASIYADWIIDDIDQLERPVAETIFILEIEKGNQEMNLYYSVDGFLLREETDNGGDSHFPAVIPEEIIDFVLDMYPKALILDVDRDEKGTEVDIFFNYMHKEVVFDKLNNWMYTKWEILPSNVPDEILNTLKNSEYALYRIEEVEVFEKGTGKFYKLELEKGDVEIELYFNEKGEIIDSIF